MSEPKLRKAELKVLERVYAAEIEGRLPCQIANKTARSLEERGYLDYGTRVVGFDRFGPVTVSGYYLSHKGRIAYCETRRDVEELTNQSEYGQ